MTNQSMLSASRSEEAAPHANPAIVFPIAALLLTTLSVVCFAMALYICDSAPTTALVLGLFGMLVLSAAHPSDDREAHGTHLDACARALRDATETLSTHVGSVFRDLWTRAS